MAAEKTSPVTDLMQMPKMEVMIPSKSLKPIRVLTLEAMSISKVKEVACQARSELYSQLLPSKFHPEGKAEAWCIDVADLIRGEEYMLICNTVLASSLARLVPPLTGRYFAIKCGEIPEGKTYRKVQVIEMALVK